jgi:hypothetical protein
LLTAVLIKLLAREYNFQMIISLSVIELSVVAAGISAAI